MPVYWYGKHKGASLFGTGPVFGGTAADMLGWFYQGGGKDFYRELVQDILGLNVVGFYGFPMPAQPLGWFKNEITGAEQLNGLKYRTVGLAADLFQAMGVSVTQLPGGEIVPAMDRGVIDAFEFNNPTSDSRFGAQDVAKNYMLGSYHQASESFEFMFNKDRFESLDPDLQAILEHGVGGGEHGQPALAMNQYSTDLQKLQRRRRQREAHAAVDPARRSSRPGTRSSRRSSRTRSSRRCWTASAPGSSGSPSTSS